MTINEIHFSSMSERGIIHVMCILGRLQEEHCPKEKVCFVNVEETFERLSRSVDEESKIQSVG